MFTSSTAPDRLSQRCGSNCPCSLISPGSVLLMASAPSEAFTAIRSGLAAAATALSAHASMPSPLYTKTEALLIVVISRAFGSNSCGSTPAGVSVTTVTLSPPTAFVNSAMASKLAATESFSFLSFRPPAYAEAESKSSIQKTEPVDKSFFFIRNLLKMILQIVCNLC